MMLPGPGAADAVTNEAPHSSAAEESRQQRSSSRRRRRHTRFAPEETLAPAPGTSALSAAFCSGEVTIRKATRGRMADRICLTEHTWLFNADAPPTGSGHGGDDFTPPPPPPEPQRQPAAEQTAAVEAPTAKPQAVPVAEAQPTPPPQAPAPNTRTLRLSSETMDAIAGPKPPPVEPAIEWVSPPMPQMPGSPVESPNVPLLRCGGLALASSSVKTQQHMTA